MIKQRIPTAVWGGLTIFSTTTVLAVIALLALQTARMALLDSVLDNWAIREAPNTWHAEPGNMSVDLPAEFGSARSADLLVMVADQFGEIRSRTHDWPTDIDPSNWVVKSPPVVMVAGTLTAPRPWPLLSVPSGALPAGAAPAAVAAAPGPQSPPGTAATQFPLVVAHSGGEITLRHFLTHGRTGTVRWVAARATPGTLFAGVRENLVAESLRPLAWIFGTIVVSASLLGTGLTHLILMARRRERESLTEWVRQAADGLTTSTDPPGRDRELEELRLQLARLQGRLVASLEQASLFTGDAAHELRSPLTAMQVKVDRLIQRSDPASEVQKDLADIADDIHRLGSLVRRLFWLALSDAGRLQLHRAPIDLSKVLVEVAQETLEEATHIATELRVDSELRLEGDLALLTHAVTNLMSNAVKHNRAGGWVTVTAASHAANIEISIRNSVAHPLPLLRDRVFERFFRGHFARGESVEGSGIGLSLAREIARAHGGDIVVADSPPDEACFILSLPILSASAMVSTSAL